MTFQVGDIVTIGSREGLWIAVEMMPSPRGVRHWRLRQERKPFATQFDTAEAGLTLILRPEFPPGLRLLHWGEPATVIADMGDLVRCQLPDGRRPLQPDRVTGKTYHVNLGPSFAEVSKSALVTENVALLMKEAEQ